MTLPTWLGIWKMRCQGRHTLPTRYRPASRKLGTVKLRLEQLEERLTPSGFGPQDGAYIVEPSLGHYAAVKIQPGDQKIVTAGDITITNPNNTTEPRVAIARYDSLGNADASFGSGGLATPLGQYSSGSGLILQPDGKAVVTGNFAGFGAARFNANGSLDKTFGNGGSSIFSGFPPPPGFGGGVEYSSGLQSTGKIVVGGFVISNNIGMAVLARFTASGATDSGKGGFGDIVQGKATTGYTLAAFGQIFLGLAVQPDDKVVAVGNDGGGGSGKLVVARYTAAGALDKTFNGSGYSLLLPAGFSKSNANAVTLQSDGKIIVAGNSSGIDGADDMLVARYNPNGTLDTLFGGGNGYVRLDIDGTASQTSESAGSVTIQPDGKIVVAGSEALNLAGATRNVVVSRLNPNGTLDGTFGNNGFKIVAPPTGPDYHSFIGRGVALQSDGSIIVAGTDSQGPNFTNAHPLLVRFFASTPHIGSFTASPNPVIVGADLTLTAANVVALNPGSGVTQVAFYRDANGDGLLEPGTDTLLGYGTQISPGSWTFTFSTTGLASGTNTFFAVAVDSYGVFSDPFAITGQVL